MNSIAVQEKIQKLKSLLSKEYPMVLDIVQSLNASGGRALLVGGAVRDLLLQVPVKDLDIEVYGIPLHQLEVILQNFGHVRLVGKQFGVLRIDYLDIDWSIPRQDGQGRKPEVIVDPHMSLKKAFSRRDLTMNAMGIDLVTYELIDPFNGWRDMQQHLLKAPDEERFIEDPLRFFRVMQFIARFCMKPDMELQKLCATMNIVDISSDRIYQEFEKLLLRSKAPSLGIRWIKELGRLQGILPELYATIGTEQDPEWHPEGDVFEHTMQALDAAAQESKMHNLKSDEQLILCLAALCHDLGKPTTTSIINGRVRALEHDVKGVIIARRLLERIIHKNNIIETVLKLVRYHMMPGQLTSQKSGLAAYKRLAQKLFPHTTMFMLALIARADKRGRNPEKHEPLEEQTVVDIDLFLERSKEAGVLEKPEQPVLTGKDLVELVEPGPKMGKILADAYDIQINHGIVDKEELKRRVL